MAKGLDVKHGLAEVVEGVVIELLANLEVGTPHGVTGIATKIVVGQPLGLHCLGDGGLDGDPGNCCSSWRVVPVQWPGKRHAQAGVASVLAWAKGWREAGGQCGGGEDKDRPQYQEH